MKLFLGVLIVSVMVILAEHQDKGFGISSGINVGGHGVSSNLGVGNQADENDGTTTTTIKPKFGIGSGINVNGHGVSSGFNVNRRRRVAKTPRTTTEKPTKTTAEKSAKTAKTTTEKPFSIGSGIDVNGHGVSSSLTAGRKDKASKKDPKGQKETRNDWD